MVTPLKGDSKLADAGIAHHRGDLEYGLGRSREELRGPGHALLQKILVDWDPINLAETGLQRCAGNSELLRQAPNCQPLVQVSHHVFLDLAYGLDLALGMVIALRCQGQPLPLRVEQEQDFQRLDNIVVPDMSQLQSKAENRASLQSAALNIQGSFQAREMDSPRSECMARRVDHAVFASIRTRVP